MIWRPKTIAESKYHENGSATIQLKHYFCTLQTFLLTFRFMKTLAQAALHQPLTIRSIAESSLKPKLLEMGLYAGKRVSVLFKAPFGDPIAVDVDGYVLSMRLNEAVLVEIEERQA